jgi:hypothetical protein
MKTIKITAILTYDDEMMHSGNDDMQAKDWFKNSILLSEELIVHSNEICDEVGTIKILKIHSLKGEHNGF